MIGHSLEDLDYLRRELGQEPVSGSFRMAGDALVDLGGAALDLLNPVGPAAQSRMTSVENVIKPALASRGVSGGTAKGLLGLGRMGARLAPGLAGLGVVGAAADTLLDDTNFSNKAQDALGMGVGALLGTPLGPGPGLGPWLELKLASMSVMDCNPSSGGMTVTPLSPVEDFTDGTPRTQTARSIPA